MLGQPNGQPLSEQQIDELNGHIETLPVVVALKENDERIMKKLGGLEIGQTEIEERLDEGAAQFKLLWTEVGEMKNSIHDLSRKMDTIGKSFNDGIEKLSKEIFNSKLDAAMDSNTKLAQENQDLKNKLDKKDSKDWDVKKIILTSLLAIVCLGIGVALGWK